MSRKRQRTASSTGLSHYRSDSNSTYPFSEHSPSYSRALSQAVGAYAGGPVGELAAGALYDMVYPGPAAALPQNKKGMGRATYAGRFKKPKYKKPTHFDKCARLGSLTDVEQFGNVTDPHCVYVGHSTWQVDQISYAIRFALIRKLFAAGGIKIINRFEELPLSGTTLSQWFRLAYIYQNPVNATQTTVVYDITDNETLSNVVLNFVNFTNELNTYILGDESRMPYKLCLYEDSTALGTQYRIKSTIEIGDEYFEMFSYSNLKLQNRTQGDTAAAGNLETERTDSQPLVASIYQFRNGDSRLVSASSFGVGTNILNGTNINSVRLLRAGTVATPREFGATIDFQNAPVKGIFNNCTGVSKTILNPGQMKECIIYHKYSGMGINFFKQIVAGNVTSSLASNIRGRNQLCVFEEKMRTIGTNPVTIHYERKHRIGCFSVTKRRGAVMPHMTALNTDLV